MSTDPDKKAGNNAAGQRLRISLHSLWIGLAAIGCAVLMEAGQVDYTYPLKVFLKGVVADNAVMDDHLYKIKL